MTGDKSMTLPTAKEELSKFEDKHVHEVYNAVATHFSDTRYKAWPVVQDYIDGLPDGSIGADIGCGNGKYLLAAKHAKPRTFCIGSDFSDELIKICVNQRNTEALVADALRQPFRTGTMDFALSIAVIHHFSSPERRKAAIQEMIRVIRIGGTGLVYVWAFEQKGRRKFTEQDVFVPWHMPAERYVKPNTKNNEANDVSVHTNVDGKEELVYQRYYHLFVEGEVEKLVKEIPGVNVLRSGYDHDNWWVVIEKIAE